MCQKWGWMLRHLSKLHKLDIKWTNGELNFCANDRGHESVRLFIFDAFVSLNKLPSPSSNLQKSISPPDDRVEIIISLTIVNFGNLAIFVRVLWGRVSLVSDLAGPSDGDGARGAVQMATKFFESFHNIWKYYYLGLLLLPGRLWWERATNSLPYADCHYEWWSWD